eukprot:SAG31_NODE_15579_length_748_cov_0.844376_1_plen_44_part_10
MNMCTRPYPGTPGTAVYTCTPAQRVAARNSGVPGGLEYRNTRRA